MRVRESIDRITQLEELYETFIGLEDDSKNLGYECITREIQESLRLIRIALKAEREVCDAKYELAD